jgi:lipopolysaccharide transport system ATP-binding protein
MSSDLPDEVAVRIRGLAKTYRIHTGWTPGVSLRDEIMRLATLRFLHEGPARTFEALAGVDLDIRQGEVMALLGANGAGKSTLLKILCRITAPTAGSITYRGRIAAILEVGTGFHPELSGRENIYLNGAILGLNRDAINRAFPAIVAFAEIENFLDEPVKRFSSGMQVRLAFSIAAHLDADILVIDEALAVGDQAFRAKCIAHVKQHFFNGQRTVILVSHDLDTLRALASRAVVLELGRIAYDGPVEGGIARYLTPT